MLRSDSETAICPTMVPTASGDVEDRKRRLWGLFCPMPEAGSERLDELLGWLDALGVETVGIGNVGPYLPALRPSRVLAQTLADDYWKKYASKRVGFAQAWHPGLVTLDNGAEVSERRERWEATLPVRWQPGRHPSLCMAAAAARRLHDHSDAQFATRHDLVLESVSHEKGKDRSRTVERMVVRGDDLWAMVGAWPWAAFLGEAGEGAMPAAWWEDERAASSLRTFLAEQAAAAQRQAESAANTARVLRWSLRGPD